MAVYKGPVCKLCRREGVKLFLKGERCLSAKCSLEKKEYPPGQHGQRRIRESEFGKQLREKQKVKRAVFMTEKQFRVFFKEADGEEGPTGANLLIRLETRLDNVVQRFKFASSIKQARQLVLHRHIKVNSAICNIPSYRVKEGDKITIRKKSRKLSLIKENLEENEEAVILEWLKRNSSKFSGKVLREPTREEISLVGGDIKENLIVELYSK